MKTRIALQAGVTLLEIILVLMIAAVVIILSIRYYNSGLVSSQANIILRTVYEISAAADSTAQTVGNYTSTTSANIEALAGGTALILPWGGTVSVSGGFNSYSASISSMPAAVCIMVTPELKTNRNYNILTSCGSGPGLFSYSYTPNNAP